MKNRLTTQTQNTHQVTVSPPHLSEAKPPAARIRPEGSVKIMVIRAADLRLSPYSAM